MPKILYIPFKLDGAEDLIKKIQFWHPREPFILVTYDSANEPKSLDQLLSGRFWQEFNASDASLGDVIAFSEGPVEIYVVGHGVSDSITQRFNLNEGTEDFYVCNGEGKYLTIPEIVDRMKMDGLHADEDRDLNIHLFWCDGSMDGERSHMMAGEFQASLGDEFQNPNVSISYYDGLWIQVPSIHEPFSPIAAYPISEDMVRSLGPLEEHACVLNSAFQCEEISEENSEEDFLFTLNGDDQTLLFDTGIFTLDENAEFDSEFEDQIESNIYYSNRYN